MALLEVRNLQVNYGPIQAVKGIDLDVEKGTLVALLGANGAGKSTFLKVLSGEVTPTRGSVAFGPHQRLSVLKQDHFEYDECTVLDTVLMGHQPLWSLMQEKKALYAKADFSEEDGIRAGELEEKFAEMDGWNAESDAAELTADKLPEGFASIPLPGHFFDMVGFRTPDDVVFLADCLSSREILDKYQIGFIYDVAGYLDTLEQVKKLSARCFVPAHAEVTEDIVPLADYNIAKVHEVAEQIEGICREPHCFERVLQSLFAQYELTMTFEQYVLVSSTVRSYLAWLKDTGRVDGRIENNMLLWETVI